MEPKSRTERVRQVRERLVSRGTVTARADGRSHELFPVAIGLEEGLALREWVRREGAVRTLEIGLGYAISTLFICEGLLENEPDGRHLACDPYQFTSPPMHRPKYGGVGLDVLEDAEVRDLVEFHEEESQILLPRLVAEGRRFDLAFVDGNHQFEGAFLDLIYCGRLLEEGSIVFADDAQLPGVRQALDFCVTNLDWTLEEEGAEGDVHEWVVLRTGPDQEFRPFDHFVGF